MSEIALKHCPLCGGPAHLYTAGRIPAAVGYPLSAHVCCYDCNLDMAVPSKGGERALRAAEKRAAERWNRRAERTCRFIPEETEEIIDGSGEVEGTEPAYGCDGFDCSECGYPMLSDPDNGWFDAEDGYRPKFNFCPNCGARVVTK